MIKHMIRKESLPTIDYLYLDMNGIIYKCPKLNIFTCFVNLAKHVENGCCMWMIENVFVIKFNGKYSTVVDNFF